MLVTGVSLVLLTGCSATAVKREVTDVTVDSTGQRAEQVRVPGPFDRLDRRAYNLYVNGLLLEGEGDLYGAAQSFRLAFRYYPDSYEIGASYARALYRLRQYGQAVEILSKLRPQDEDVLGLSASCYRQLRAEESAKDTYLKLISLDSSQTAAYTFLAHYYRRKDNLDSTLWAYRHLARIQPDNVQLLNEFGRLLVLKGEISEAKKTYVRSLDLRGGPHNLGAIISLGELYELSQQLDSAEVMFKQGLEYEPSNMLLLKGMVRLSIQQNSLAKALPYGRAIAELSPGDGEASRNLAILYFSLDSLRHSDSIFTSLVTAGEKVAANHYYLGRIAAMTEDFERARDEFLIRTQLADTIPNSWLDLAYAYRQLGETDNEIATYLTGLNRMRSEANAITLYFALGVTYERSGIMDSATAAFETILQHSPDHDQTLNYLGYSLTDRGLRLEYARGLIARAVELQPNNAAYLDSYGWVHYRLGNYDSALHYLKSAAGLDGDPVILDHLGDAYHAVGNFEEAHKSWEKALEQQPDNAAIKEKLNR